MTVHMPWFLPLGVLAGLLGARAAYHRVQEHGPRRDVWWLLLLCWFPLLVWLLLQVCPPSATAQRSRGNIRGFTPDHLR